MSCRLCSPACVDYLCQRIVKGTSARCKLTGPAGVGQHILSGALLSTTKQLKPVLHANSALRHLIPRNSQAACRSQATASHTDQPDWPGLQAWRCSDIDNKRFWGDNGPVLVNNRSNFEEQTASFATLAACAKQVLLTADPKQKAALTHDAWQRFQEGNLPVGNAEAPLHPARPSRPQLVPPKQVPTPKQSPLPLPVYMLHNLAHVELNAIDLAWDTVVRFSELNLDQAFYRDFARVADDESRHLGWCLQRLEELGSAYGDMVAHSILWDGATASSGDLAGRLAVVPMSQEAKGLDAGPRLAEKLVGCGDNRSAAIVSRIAAEEKAHVAVGVSWFTQLSAAMGEDPGTVYQHCITSLGQQEGLRPPFNHASRKEVGLQQHWYDRSMWPASLLSSGGSPLVSARTQESCSLQQSKQAEVSSAALKQLQQRMATILDVEMCNSA